jgi:hypothetical protein
MQNEESLHFLFNKTQLAKDPVISDVKRSLIFIPFHRDEDFFDLYTIAQNWETLVNDYEEKKNINHRVSIAYLKKNKPLNIAVPLTEVYILAFGTGTLSIASTSQNIGNPMPSFEISMDILAERLVNYGILDHSDIVLKLYWCDHGSLAKDQAKLLRKSLIGMGYRPSIHFYPEVLVCPPTINEDGVLEYPALKVKEENPNHSLKSSSLRN